MHSYSETSQSENSLGDHRSKIIREDGDALDKVIALWCGFSWSEIPIQKKFCVLTHTLALQRGAGTIYTLQIGLCIFNIHNWHFLDLLWKEARRKEKVKCSALAREAHVHGHTVAVTLCLFTLFFTFFNSFIFECMEFNSSIDMIWNQKSWNYGFVKGSTGLSVGRTRKV